MRRPLKSRDDSRLAFVVGGAFAIAALYFARVVFIPLALAVLFSLLLNPAVAFLEKIKIPRVLAVSLVVLSLLGILGVAGWKTSQQFVDVAGQLSTYRDTLRNKIRTVKGMQNKNLNKASDTMKELQSEIDKEDKDASAAGSHARQPPGSSPSRPLMVEQVLHPNPIGTVIDALSPLASVGLVVLFTIFIIIGREDLRNRFIRLAGGGRLPVMTQALDEASSRINRYLFLQSMVNVSYGAIIGGALYFIGIPNPWLWGVSAAILRFVPYLGAPLSAVMPIVLSLAVFTGWSHAFITAGVFLVLEITVANFVEPLLYGAHVGLSPLAILVAALFWTLLWGFPGLLLSTPLTVCLVVMGRHVPGLAFLYVLLGDEPAMSPAAHFYQRLLASDLSEAREVLEESRKEKSLQEFYGSVLMPALILAEEDRHRGELDEETQSYIYQSTRELVEEFASAEIAAAEEGQNGVAISPSKSALRAGTIVCVPARDHADEIAAMMLSHLLRENGCQARSIEISPASEMLAEVNSAEPQRVLISALPPFAVDHARRLYLKLQSQSPGLQIDICLWHYEGDLPKVAQRLGLRSGHHVYTTLEQVADEIAGRKEEAASKMESPVADGRQD